MALEITLNNDAALVLFELLASRTDIGDSLGLGGPERTKFDLLEASLERVLAEPFAANYSDLLLAAKRQLSQQRGTMTELPYVLRRVSTSQLERLRSRPTQGPS
jgi:hypothetical protein